MNTNSSLSSMNAASASALLNTQTPAVPRKNWVRWGAKAAADVRFVPKTVRNRSRIRAIKQVSDFTVGQSQVDITWEIVVGALAGITPFVVAGIEFSKRIAAQRRCKVCGGSGLVLREKYYFRCPACGGFLPWQSWKRFFSG